MKVCREGLWTPLAERYVGNSPILDAVHTSLEANGRNTFFVVFRPQALQPYIRRRMQQFIRTRLDDTIYTERIAVFRPWWMLYWRYTSPRQRFAAKSLQV